MQKGWYYHWEWACDSEPEYFDGVGDTPLDVGPFKTKIDAYKDQRANHLHDVMESKGSAKWCSDQIKKERLK